MVEEQANVRNLLGCVEAKNILAKSLLSGQVSKIGSCALEC